MVSKDTNKTLFDTYQMGDLTLSNRIGMAPLTRMRTDPKTGIPNDLMVKYYSMRAKAGFLVTEGAPVSHAGNCFFGAGCIYTKEQAEGWKRVNDAVHENGGKIILQVFHAGRAADPSKTGEISLAPSALPIRYLDKNGNKTEGHVPKEMTLDDIKLVKQQFKEAALLAREAGFDGIQLHLANGYLLDQFIQDSTNKRTDDYGGSIENRCRFCLEIIDELISIFGKGRVGIRISPVGRFQDMFDSNPVETYTYLLKRLDEKGIAFVEIIEGSVHYGPSYYIPGKEQISNLAKTFRGAFKGTLITNCSHTPESALEFIQNGWADLVTFGKLFLANPDLIARIKNGWDFNKWDFSTFYIGGEKGYIDYPLYQPEKVDQEKEEKREVCN